MFTVEKSVHVLAVHSLEESFRFYRDVLGMTEVFREGNMIGMLKLGNFEIFLGECKGALDPHQLGDHRPFARVKIKGLDAYCDVVRKKYSNLSTPENKPWGLREFALETPDGHRITFYDEISVS